MLTSGGEIQRGDVVAHRFLDQRFDRMKQTQQSSELSLIHTYKLVKIMAFSKMKAVNAGGFGRSVQTEMAQVGKR